MRQTTRPHLVLCFPMTQYWCRMIALGAAKYARSVANWYPFLTEHLTVDMKLQEGRELHDWAGVIGIFYESHAGLVKRLKDWNIPVVNVASEPLIESIPTVCNDEMETGRMAARYFLGEGHRNFAYSGLQGRYFSHYRERGYVEHLKESGVDEVIIGPQEGAYNPMADWVRTLPVPCAVLTANDTRARHTLWSCASNGLNVPDEISVLGIDDDELYCHMNHVATSSVAPAWETIGNRAAAVLDELTQNPLAHAEDYRETIMPKGVTVRQSTDHVAVEDPFVARALSVIREDCTEGLKVGDLALRLGVSRRTLERRFDKALQLPVHTAIVNARLEKAHRLISSTSLPIGEIAARTGFNMHSRFDQAFRKRFGMTPTQVRRGSG